MLQLEKSYKILECGTVIDDVQNRMETEILNSTSEPLAVNP